jgi:TatD DNase family protein
MIDAHAHLDSLDDDVDVVLARAAEAGVDRVVTIGVDVKSSEWAAACARERSNVWATAGLHPHDAEDCSPAALQRIEDLAREERVVGVGETGLDYYYDNSPRSEQRRVFAEQIRIAHRAGKTLVIHTRDAWDDTFAILAEEGVPTRVVFHCWTGGPQEAERALEIGAVLSFSGIVTFRNATPIREAAAMTPLSSLIVETDAPFLTPVPHRGKRNEPAYVRHVSDEIAAIKGLPLDDVAAATAATTVRVFSLR